MTPIVREGDLTVCGIFEGPKPHVGGPVAEGIASVLAGDVPVVVQGASCECKGASNPRSATIQAGHPSVLIADKPVAGLITSHAGVVIPTLTTVIIG